MPIYEYQCTKCHEITEELQKMSDPPLRKCPHCGAKVKKLMSMNTFHLKGSGWYVTDYAGKKAPDTKSESDAMEKKPAKAEKAEKAEKKTDKPKKDK